MEECGNMENCGILDRTQVRHIDKRQSGKLEKLRIVENEDCKKPLKKDSD